MTRGRKPVPQHLKIVAGTDRPDRPAPEGIEFPLVDEPPAPPYWLNDGFALEEWHRLVPILHVNKLLTEAGVSALAMLCSVHGQLVACYVAGREPSTSLLQTYRGMVSDFGLTPITQGKVKPVGEKDSGNRFGSNGRRPR